MKLRLILVFFLFGISTFLTAQIRNIDSISTALKQHPQIDTTRVKLLNTLAFSYRNYLPDSSFFFATQSYVLAKDLNDKKGEADALKILAIVDFINGNFSNAFNKNKEALSIYAQIHDLEGYSRVLNNMATIKQNKGNYEEALAYHKQSLVISELLQNFNMMALSYSNMGIIYSILGMYVEALDYQLKSLNINEKLNDITQKSLAYSNIAHLYYHTNRPDLSKQFCFKAMTIQQKEGNFVGLFTSNILLGNISKDKKEYSYAHHYFQSAHKIAERLNDKPAIVLSLSNIGETLIEEQKYKDAEAYFQESMDLLKGIDDKEALTYNQCGLGIIYLHTNRVSKAIDYLQRSYQLALQQNYKKCILEAAKGLAKAYESVHDFEKTAFYLKQTIAYNDSILNEEIGKQFAEKIYNYELEKKQDEISLLEKEQIIQKQNADNSNLLNLWMGSGLLLIIVFSIILVGSYREIRKDHVLIQEQKAAIEIQTEELRTLNKMKDKILSVLSHDLKGPMNALSMLMYLMDENAISAGELTDFKSRINNQLSSLNLALNNLLLWSHSQLNNKKTAPKETIALQPVIEQNINLLKESAFQKNITINFHPTQPFSVVADSSQTEIIVRNLLSNAIKYTHKSGTIDIKIEDTGHFIKTSIADTGIGIDQDLALQLFSNKYQSRAGTEGEKGTGLGLLLCKDFVEQNHGTIEVSSTPGIGSTFAFTLPKAPNQINN